MKRVALSLVVVIAGLFTWTVAATDEAPISGTVKKVDPAARTLTLEVASKGKTREVVVHMGPRARVVRFARGTEAGQTGFVERELPLAEIKPGWIVSATTRHEGDREVAEVVKVVLEK
jgi:hypothetical protein